VPLGVPGDMGDSGGDVFTRNQYETSLLRLDFETPPSRTADQVCPPMPSAGPAPSGKEPKLAQDLPIRACWPAAPASIKTRQGGWMRQAKESLVEGPRIRPCGSRTSTTRFRDSRDQFRLDPGIHLGESIVLSSPRLGECCRTGEFRFLQRDCCWFAIANHDQVPGRRWVLGCHTRHYQSRTW